MKSNCKSQDLSPYPKATRLVQVSSSMIFYKIITHFKFLGITFLCKFTLQKQDPGDYFQYATFWNFSATVFFLGLPSYFGIHANQNIPH